MKVRHKVLVKHKRPSHQHLRDHVLWDLIPPELFGNEPVAVALRHSACSS